MVVAAPAPSEMFSDAASHHEVMQRFEEYKAEIAQVHKNYGGGGWKMTEENGLVRDTAALGPALANVTKSLTPAQLQSLHAELSEINGITSDLAKDWSIPPASGNTNLVPYDLSGPASMMVPRNTPLRNRLPRTKGVGLSYEFRRILGWTNSSTGGVADALPFMDSQTVQTSFGSLALRRGPKISYASDDVMVSYVEMGVSDQVNWKTQYSSMGYQDVLALSQTMKLWSHMLGEEKSILYARGASGKGYAGAISAPTITLASSASGGAVAAGTYYVKVTARGGGGESVPSAEVNTGALSGSTNQFTVTVSAEPVGSLGYNVYIGTSTGAETYVGSFSGTTFTVLATPATGGAACPTVDSTFLAQGYDGFLTVLMDPAKSGYVKRITGGKKVYDATTPANSLGDGPWQDAFAALYGASAGPNGTKLQADPDEIWVDGTIRRSLGDYVKLAGNVTSYRVQLTEEQGTGGMTIGVVASAIMNQTTGKMVPLEVHPFMPLGCSVIRSATLPVPDSEITNTSEIRCVQDYLSQDWPQIQYTIDSSTYWLGSLIHRAPQWSGAIAGLN